ncbi:hypothetical protein HBI79_145760 [Parastagonospora nodorum]|nr:hypothetical protein HBI79_145760 [Parastagonospora nodorum]
MTDSLRARTPINSSAVLYEQLAARPGLPAEVSNIDLNFVPGVAFIPNVYIANSLRARTLINLSAVSNMDLDFVPSVAFISDVYMADSLRARTLINLSAVLYEQAAARTGLSAKVGNISSTSLRARTLINLSAVLYEQADARSGLPAEVSIIDLDFVPGVAFNAMGNVELTGDLLGDADCVNNNNNNAYTVPYPDLKKYLGNSTGNNRNNLNIMVTDPTGREFSRVDMKSLTRLCLLIDGAKANRLIWMLYCKRKWAYNISKFYKGKNIQLLRPQGLTPRELGSIYVLRSVDKIRANVADVFDIVVSKLDEVPTRELSTLYFMWDKEQDYSAEELCDNGRKFYRLVITGEDTHCKQIIKKAYIMLLERALLILFMT